jgi:hypothetical protein
VAIPFTAISTGSLLLGFKTAKAATSNSLFQLRGPLTHNYGGRNEGFSLLDVPKTVIHNLEVITGYLIKGLDWLNNLPLSIPKLTADLLTAIYNFLAKIALQTPLFIFNNPFLKNTSQTFALISVSLVTLLTVFESFMQMFNKKHTSFKTIIKRYLLVASVSGFLPFAFESGFTFLNKLSDAISKIGTINGGNVNGFISGESIGFFDTLIIILFDIAAIAMMIPVCLQAGKRWWDLMCLAAIAPLALSSWVFDRHKRHFYTWWRRVKSISYVQIVYSIFILIMGIFIFATQSIHGGIFTLIIKLLIVIGGLMRLSNPPRFVTQLTGDQTDIFDEYDKTKTTLKGLYDTITLKNLKPTNFIKNKLADSQNKKLRKKYGLRHVDLNQIEKDLRKKHKRRYVSDLL